MALGQEAVQPLCRHVEPQDVGASCGGPGDRVEAGVGRGLDADPVRISRELGRVLIWPGFLWQWADV